MRITGIAKTQQMRAGIFVVVVIAIATMGCLNRKVLILSKGYDVPDSAVVSGPRVTISTVEEIPQNAPALARKRSDPTFLGKHLNLLWFATVIPVYWDTDEFHGDIARSEAISSAASAVLKKHGVPSVASGAGATDSHRSSQDDLSIQFRIRDLEVSNSLDMVIPAVIQTAISWRKFHPRIVLGCRVQQASRGAQLGAGTGTSDVKYPYHGSDSDEDKNLRASLADAIEQCIKKSGLLETREKLRNARYAELIERGRSQEEAGDAAAAWDSYSQAYLPAVTTDQAVELAQTMSRLAKSKAAKPVPEAAEKMMTRGRAAIKMAKTADDILSAALDMEQAVALAPWWSAGHFNTALAAETAGQWALAAKHYKMYLALSPSADDKEKVNLKLAELELHQEKNDPPPDKQ